MSKRRNRVTVLCFYADGTQNKYQFNSAPDLGRVQDEAKRDNVAAALVFDRKDKCCACFITPFVREPRNRRSVGETIRFIESIFGQAGKHESAPDKRWQPKVGERVHWDGVHVNEEGGTLDTDKAGEYVLDKTPGNVSHKWVAPYSFSGTGFWTTIDHLSPVKPDTAEDEG